MKPVHELAAVDLNLLLVLDALLREGSATPAAKRLARTQSAISHALARLRDAFADPLFVRVGSALLPTARAEAMRVPLAEILERALGLFGEGPELDPSKLERSFCIGSSDILEHSVLPGLLTVLAERAPGVSLATRPSNDDIERAIQLRDVDVAVMARLQTQAGMTIEHLFDDRLELLLRRGHPALKHRIDLDAYCALGHVFVAPRGQPGGPVDDALHVRGRRRRIAYRTSSFTAALRVVAETDLVVAMPSRFVRNAPTSLVTRPLPLPDITHSFRLVWNAALDADPGHRWFRALLREAVLSVWRDDEKAPAATLIA